MKSMKVPFIDLIRQQSPIRPEIDQRIRTVLDHGKFVNGPEIEELEGKIAGKLEDTHVVACSSGTDALTLAFLGAGLKAGDEVITTPFTFFATVETMILLGIRPVFVDIEEDFFNLNTDLLEEALTDKTKAIVPVSLYGQTPDMDPLMIFAKNHNLTVIEDGAQSLGATYKGHQSCSIAPLSCTSFFPAKPFGCYGDGGAVMAKNQDMDQRLRSFRDHGQMGRYHHVHIGINGRMDTLQAAIMLAKFDQYWDVEIQGRQDVAKMYQKQIQELNLPLSLPQVAKERTSIWAQYTILVKDRERVQKNLMELGVPTAVHYPTPVYAQPALTQYKIPPEKFPVTERISKEVLSLPMHAFMTEEEVSIVVDGLQKALKS